MELAKLWNEHEIAKAKMEMCGEELRRIEGWVTYICTLVKQFRGQYAELSKVEEELR